jgi:excinuclease ABC subunit C
VNSALETKLKDLPTEPGVYFHKDASGEIIYVGKAAVLRNRVRQYFQKSRLRDPKTDALVAEIADTDWVTVETELDALFLEAEMIRRYMPRYNILLRDDKSFTYVRINIKSDYPSVTFTRRPLDDGAEYFGPYISKAAIAEALKYLRRVFPYSTHTPTNTPKRECLQAQLGLCPGLESGKTSIGEYRKTLRQLMTYLRGSRVSVIRELEKSMQQAAKDREYESAAWYRNKLRSLKQLDKQIIFGDRELHDINKDRGLLRLTEELGLIAPPKRIEGYDISHMSGTDNVASMVVFVNGLPSKGDYRKYKMRLPGNNDFGHMTEVITRRLSEKNIKQWGLPDLFLIDGGKGQVHAAYDAMIARNQNVPMIGLAKRYEEIIVPQVVDNKVVDFKTVTLPHSDEGLKLLMRIRDESHRFAVSYHSVLKRQRQKVNALEEMPGIGPQTRKQLQRKFGSTKAIFEATHAELAEVVGDAKASIIVSSKPS